MAGVAGLAAGDGAASGAVAAKVVRLVLDTNVWLDWLVFDEPSLAPLRAAHALGRVEVVMDDACEAELARVLAYDLGKHSIDAGAQARCLEQCRKIARRVGSASHESAPAPATAAARTSAPATATATATAAAGATATAPATAAATATAKPAAATAATASPTAPAAVPASLPRCRDPHDQKFLELALAAQADALVTKDQALLELARRKLPFRIAAPQALGPL